MQQASRDLAGFLKLDIARVAQRIRSRDQQTAAVYLQVEAEFGVVDTAAAQALIGEHRFHRLQNKLEKVGLTSIELPRAGEAQPTGVSGKAEVVSRRILPLMIAGTWIFLETAVVKDDVPLLLPVLVLDRLQADVAEVGAAEVHRRRAGHEEVAERPPGGASCARQVG